MIRVCVFSPARDKYQQASSVCSLFQMAAPTELTRAMTSRMPNKTRICMLVTRSTLERFSGALVEFWDVDRAMNTKVRNTKTLTSRRCWMRVQLQFLWGEKVHLQNPLNTFASLIEFVIHNYKQETIIKNDFGRTMCQQSKHWDWCTSRLGHFPSYECVTQLIKLILLSSQGKKILIIKKCQIKLQSSFALKFFTPYTEFTEFRQGIGFTCISFESWPV